MAAKIKQITYAEAEAAYWATQTYDVDTVLTSSGADVLGCSRVTLKWTRDVPSGLRDDVCLTSLWVGKAAGGALYSMIPLAELAAMETALDTMAAAWASLADSTYHLTEYAWHQVNEASPRDETGRAQKMGPAVRTTVKAVAGANSGVRLPDQVALNTTLRTASRKHWGRNYWPGVTHLGLTTDYGRFSTSFVDVYANGVDALHNTWQTAGYQLGVWSQLHPAFMTPKQIEADDIPDIQRRRRAKQPLYRKIIS